MGSAAHPDLARECRPPGRRGRADHCHGGRHAHFRRFALHAHHSGKPRAQGFRSRALGIELTGAPSESCAFQGEPTLDIARSASPDQIFGRRVLFVPVNVSHFRVSYRPTESATFLARRGMGGGPVTQSAIADRFLAPPSPSRGQSWSSAWSSSSTSSSSASSDGLTISATASSASWRS